MRNLWKRTKNKLLISWHYIECYWTKIQRLFGIRKDTSVIPKGIYCYQLDNERNKTHTCSDGGYWIIPCPYYRHISNRRMIAGCTYIGFIGWHDCLWDSCKICGINDKINEEDLL